MNHILKYITNICARKSSFGAKTKALKISKNLKNKRLPAHFLAKAKDANQLFFYVALHCKLCGQCLLSWFVLSDHILVVIFRQSLNCSDHIAKSRSQVRNALVGQRKPKRELPIFNTTKPGA
jgi:hypothetical protein